MSILVLAACSAGKTASNEEVVIGKINGEAITKDDVEFYKVINLIQIQMYREADQKKYSGAELEQAMKFWDAREMEAKNQNYLLTQIFRLRAMALLAQEKGHQANPDEVTKEIELVKETYNQYPSALSIIDQFGKEKFWQNQQEQYERIVLMKKVQNDVIEKVKEANPEAQGKEITMLAEKKYEELLVSQMGTLNIEISKN